MAQPLDALETPARRRARRAPRARRPTSRPTTGTPSSGRSRSSCPGSTSAEVRDAHGRLDPDHRPGARRRPRRAGALRPRPLGPARRRRRRARARARRRRALPPLRARPDGRRVPLGAGVLRRRSTAATSSRSTRTRRSSRGSPAPTATRCAASRGRRRRRPTCRPRAELYAADRPDDGAGRRDVKLYDAPRCPFCARVRLALAEKGVAYETVEIDLAQPAGLALRAEPDRQGAGARRRLRAARVGGDHGVPRRALPGAGAAAVPTAASAPGRGSPCSASTTCSATSTTRFRRGEPNAVDERLAALPVGREPLRRLRLSSVGDAAARALRRRRCPSALEAWLEALARGRRSRPSSRSSGGSR